MAPCSPVKRLEGDSTEYRSKERYMISLVRGEVFLLCL